MRCVAPVPGTLAVQQPARFRPCDLDEPEQERGGQRHARLVMSPRPFRNTELAGELDPSFFTEELETYFLKPLGQGHVVTDRSGH